MEAECGLFLFADLVKGVCVFLFERSGCHVGEVPLVGTFRAFLGFRGLRAWVAVRDADHCLGMRGLGSDWAGVVWLAQRGSVSVSAINRFPLG